jgi:hypothetical protein
LLALYSQGASTTTRSILVPFQTILVQNDGATTAYDEVGVGEVGGYEMVILVLLPDVFQQLSEVSVLALRASSRP